MMLVSLYMPEFKIRSQFDDIAGIINDEFSTRLDGSPSFSINETFSTLGEILQFTSLDISQEGVEAAALTVATLYGALDDSKPATPHKIFVDRPFAFQITDNKTKEVLFAGVVNKLDD